jgi:peroxiredoxin
VPEVTLRTADGEAFDLSAAVSRKPAVLIFYRGGWCPYCNLHLGQLQEAEADLVKLGYQILAISPDRPAKLAESVEKGKLSYTLLSDAAMDAAKAFGIAFRVDDTTVEKYKGYGIDLEAASGQAHHLLPVLHGWRGETNAPGARLEPITTSASPFSINFAKRGSSSTGVAPSASMNATTVPVLSRTPRRTAYPLPRLSG